jgi:hypothetical protein
VGLEDGANSELQLPFVGARARASDHASDRAHPGRTPEAFLSSGYGTRGGKLLLGLVDRAGLEPATS